MWWRRLAPRTLAGTFLVLQLCVVGLVLMVAGVVSVRQSTTQFAASSGDRVLGAAENVAGNPLVKSVGVALDPATQLAPLLEAARIQSGATVVLLADVGPADHHLHRPDGDADNSRAARRLRLGGSRLGRRPQPRRAATDRRECADLLRHRELLGLALVGQAYPDTWSILRSGVPELLLLILLAAAAGVTGSLAAGASDQETDPRTGAGSDRQPCRPPGGVAAQHP